MKHLLLALSLLFCSGTLTACSSVYFAAMEKIGVPKRDLMVKRVKAAQNSQQEAKQQFKDALEKFRVVLNVKGGKLGAKYDELSAELARSEKRAEDVRSRIADVEEVSEALFAEWKRELGQYSNKNLRVLSQQRLKNSQARYSAMIKAMHQVETKLQPVLQPLRDNVLYLKHNLNAQVLSSLGEELRSIESNVAALLKDLTLSVEESNRFLNEMEQ